jgi:hypothetical protein
MGDTTGYPPRGSHPDRRDRRLKRSTWPTIKVMSLRRAAAMMALSSSTVEAIGFSTITCTLALDRGHVVVDVQVGRCRNGRASMPAANNPRRHRSQGSSAH